MYKEDGKILIIRYFVLLNTVLQSYNKMPKGPVYIAFGLMGANIKITNKMHNNSHGFTVIVCKS